MRFRGLLSSAPSSFLCFLSPFSVNKYDILSDYLPLHLKWIEKGNSWIVKSLSENRQLDRQAFSQLLVGVRNLYLDLEELQDLLIEVSNEIYEN